MPIKSHRKSLEHIKFYIFIFTALLSGPKMREKKGNCEKEESKGSVKPDKTLLFIIG